MEKINICIDQIKSLSKVGEGSEAIIYQFNNDRLLKLYHTPNSYLENNIFLLTEIQPIIKKTHFPLGTAYLKEKFKGSIHVYHKNSVNFEILKNSNNHSYRIDKFIQLNDNVNELIINNIFFDDLDSENVLITPSGKVELIDNESSCISTNSTKNNKRKICIYNQLKSMIIECLFNEEYFFNDDEVLSNYNVKPEYIDQFISSNISYEFFSEFFNYLEKDKILKH